MTFGYGLPVMAKATKRTFYIERYGDEYRVVKVWEVGAEFTRADMQYCFLRVMETEPDERIIADQSFGITRNAKEVNVTAQDQQTLSSVLGQMGIGLINEHTGQQF